MAPSRQPLISVERSVKDGRAGVGLLSVVVIARNEADRLGRCLASVGWADERLVLDSGSLDGTPRIARQHGARVIHTDWPGYGRQRNRGLDLAASPWVLFLDADEWLERDAVEGLEAFLRRPTGNGARLARRTHWLGRTLGHGRSYPDRQLRLARKDRARWTTPRVHEVLTVEGPVMDLAGHIGHAPYRDFGEHLSTIESYSALAAEDLIVAGRRAGAHDVIVRPALRFVDAYLLRRGFRDGPAGLVVAGLGALYTANKWRRVWRAQR